MWTPDCTLSPSESLDQLAQDTQANGLERLWNEKDSKRDPDNHTYTALKLASAGNAAQPQTSATTGNVQEWSFHLANGLRAIER